MVHYTGLGWDLLCHVCSVCLFQQTFYLAIGDHFICGWDHTCTSVNKKYPVSAWSVMFSFLRYIGWTYSHSFIFIAQSLSLLFISTMPFISELLRFRSSLYSSYYCSVLVLETDFDVWFVTECHIIFMYCFVNGQAKTCDSLFCYSFWWPYCFANDNRIFGGCPFMLMNFNIFWLSERDLCVDWM